MELVSVVLIGVVALMHVLFLVLEMFLWAAPIGLKVFRHSHADALKAKALAANQGLYNGFLVAGLIWSLLHPSPEVAWQLALFFLNCVVVAGVFGALTVSRRIFYIQALPAALALGAVVLG